MIPSTRMEGSTLDETSGSSQSTRIDHIDPEVDADVALKTLRQIVLDDAPDDAPPLEQWHGLDAYIEELCSFGVDRLSREPHDLTAASLRLKNDLEDVACGNYRALIESFECADAVRDGISRVQTRLDDLVQALPILAEATRQFSVDVAERQKIRDRRLRTAGELRAVSDILEMPRIMRTLVAAELYDEALELRDNSLKLAMLHPDDQLISSVCDEMHTLTQQMILQLLVLLRSAVQLPTCLRVVGFLRRLRLFPEFRLRMIFLHCRGEWMRASLDLASATSPQTNLVNLCDNTRSMVFEIVTQYHAVFSDDDDDDLDSIDPLFANGSSAVSSSYSSSILSDWTLTCVTDYLERLEEGVKNLTDGAALNTVLQQAMFCGQSLGRVGADFRAALPPMFESAVMRIFTSQLNAALRQFEMMIEDNRWAPVGSSALRKDRGFSLSNVPGNDGDGSGSVTAINTDVSVQSNEPYDPPSGVLDSPPLAVFLNGILVALNDLRLCAPVSLGDRLGETLQWTLIKAGEYMGAMGGPGGAFLKRSDRQHFVAMSLSLRDLCVRHAARCLDRCMDRSGLVDLDKVDSALADVFGETLAPTVLSSQTIERLNGVENDDDDATNNPGESEEQHTDLTESGNNDDAPEPTDNVIL